MSDPVVDICSAETKIAANEDAFTWQIVSVHDWIYWKVIRVVGHMDVPGQRTINGGGSCEDSRRCST